MTGDEREVRSGGTAGVDRRGGGEAPAASSDLASPGHRRRTAAGLLTLLILLVIVVFAALLLGAVSFSPSRIARTLLNPDPGDPATIILREIRLPRIVVAALVGAALSLAGTLLQAFFRNPMAGPYVVGVSAGAGLAAVAVLTAGLSARWGPFDTVTAAAFAGGIGAVALVYALARRIQFLQAEGLLLIGIAVGAVCSALTSMLLLFSEGGAQGALFWMLGTFATARWSTASLLTGVVVLAGGASILLSRHLNLLLWGEEVALSLGSPVSRVRAWVLVLASLLAAGAVAASGVIGFVGLMVPHLVRGLLRTVDHRFVLPGSALLGAILAVSADAAARSLLAPTELPVGAVTSALGAPFLVVLVVRRHRRMGGR